MDIHVKLDKAALTVLIDRLQGLNSGLGRIEVGFPEDEAHYSGLGTGGLARLLTRGNHRIAPRPFVQQFVARYEPDIAALVRDAFERYIHGGLSSDIRRVWNDVGIRIEDMMKVFARNGSITPENKPYTVKMKGFNKPYVWNGDLVGSIRHWVIA
jgi:hypothetical protein